MVYVRPRVNILNWALLLGLLLAMLRHWQHTLLAIAVGFRVASDNTLYWVLLWAMRGFGQHTLLGNIRSDVGTFINGFKIILF
jgi:hypothetical protein